VTAATAPKWSHRSSDMRMFLLGVVLSVVMVEMVPDVYPRSTHACPHTLTESTMLYLGMRTIVET
jgi:hypothetical protein